MKYLGTSRLWLIWWLSALALSLACVLTYLLIGWEPGASKTGNDVPGRYIISRGDWASILILRSDHNARQELYENGKIVATVEGKWDIRAHSDWLSRYDVVISSCIDLRDNPKDDPPGLHDSLPSMFGKQVSEGFPVEYHWFSPVTLVIDEEEGLVFTKE